MNCPSHVEWQHGLKDLKLVPLVIGKKISVVHKHGVDFMLEVRDWLITCSGSVT